MFQILKNTFRFNASKWKTDYCFDFVCTSSRTYFHKKIVRFGTKIFSLNLFAVVYWRINEFTHRRTKWCFGLKIQRILPINLRTDHAHRLNPPPTTPLTRNPLENLQITNPPAPLTNPAPLLPKAPLERIQSPVLLPQPHLTHPPILAHNRHPNPLLLIQNLTLHPEHPPQNPSAFSGGNIVIFNRVYQSYTLWEEGTSLYE